MTDEIKYVYLKSHPLFSNMSEQTIKEACLYVKTRTVYKGESFSYGDGGYSRIYLLIKGKIKIAEIGSESNELIKDLLTAPDVFGDTSLDNNIHQNEYAEALTANTIVCYFSVADFRSMLQMYPTIAISYTNLVTSKLKRMELRHSDLVFHDARARLIRFIKNWARTDGNRVGDKIVLTNYLTHTDIANVIATSRQSVNTLFNELRESGLLHYDRKYIQLNNPLIWN